MHPIMLGHWIQPWPGEYILGEVIAVEGDRVVCRCRNGLRFTVAMADITDQILWPPEEAPTMRLLPRVAS